MPITFHGLWLESGPLEICFGDVKSSLRRIPLLRLTSLSAGLQTRSQNLLGHTTGSRPSLSSQSKASGKVLSRENRDPFAQMFSQSCFPFSYLGALGCPFSQDIGQEGAWQNMGETKGRTQGKAQW